MADMKKLNDQDLDNISGGVSGRGLTTGGISGEGLAADGVSGSGLTGWRWVSANVKTGYLALRSAPSYDYRNEIAKIVDGTSFQIKSDQTAGDYVYARFDGMEGWVNSKYVTGFQVSGSPIM